ncbi:hypothetical protein [Streptomyces tauricus]|uniref:hypothetical protein n=1 Tax=Streptomyces tauricus TaxID=68274 RepID=UPI0033E129DE
MSGRARDGGLRGEGDTEDTRNRRVSVRGAKIGITDPDLVWRHTSAIRHPVSDFTQAA